MKYARSLTAGLAMTLACAFAQEADAASLKQGECKPFAEMIAALNAEGQVDMIQADKWTKEPSSRPLYMITSDKEGNGYEIGGDRFNFNIKTGNFDGSPLPEKMCVSAVLSDVKLANAFEKRAPQSFYVPGSLTQDQLVEISKRDNLGNARDHNSMMDRCAERGRICPALQARVMNDGQPGPRLVIMMDIVENRIGSSNTVWEDGYAVGTAVLGNVGYSETALQHLEQRGPRVAALEQR